MSMTDASTTFAVPEFFVTDVGLIERAGGGNLRIIRCIRRGGVLYPVFSLVTPMLNLLTSTQVVKEAAQGLCDQDWAAPISH